MKNLQYCEPDGDNNTKVIRVSVEEAIKQSKTTAYRHGYTYSNDEDALQDFIAVNWASYEDEEQ